MQIPAGKLVDVAGARRVAFASLAITMVTNGIAMLAPDPALVTVMRALAGVGTAFGFVAGIDYVRAQGGTALAQGIFGGVGLSAAGLALAVVPQVEDVIGWRAPFATAAALALLAAPLLLAAPPDSRVPRPPRARVRDVVGDRRLYRICVVYMASFGLSVVLSNWVVPLLTRAGDYSDGVAGAIGALILAGGVVSRPLGGMLVRDDPSRTRLVICLAFAVSLAGTAMIATAGPPAVIVPGALLLGLASGVPFAASFATATRLRPDAPAVAAAMVNMSANLVVVFCTPLLGLSFSLPGDGRIGFAAACALWLAAIAVTPGAKELDGVPAGAVASRG